jgi:hypothetical protein
LIQCITTKETDDRVEDKNKGEITDWKHVQEIEGKRKIKGKAVVRSCVDSTVLFESTNPSVKFVIGLGNFHLRTNQTDLQTRDFLLWNLGTTL